MPYIGRDLNRGNYLKLDDISSSFNSSTKTFNLTVGGSAFTPGSAFSILVSVGGVIQEPESAYQVENSEITFANAPTAQDSFFCIALGSPIGIGVPGNSTVNGTQMAKPFNYDGFFYLNDSSNRVGINSSIPTVALDVDGVIKASSFSGGSGGINAGVGTFTGLDVNGNGDISGNLVLGGDLTVNGTTTTLDTNLIGVDRVEVGANSSTVVGVAITQSGSADIVNLFDGTTEVLTVIDGGRVGIKSDSPTTTLDVAGGAQFKTNGAAVKIESSLGTNFTQLQLVNSGGSFYIGRENSAGNWFQSGTGYASVLRSDGAYPLIFRVNSDNRLIIDSSGRLLLGTTTEGHADADDFTIGTSTNSAGITIRTNTSGVGRLFFSDGTSGAAEYQGYIQYDHNNQRLSLGSGGATRLTVNSNGRIGVGTDDTQIQFQVGVSGEIGAGDINRRFVGIKMTNSIGVIRSTFYSGKSGTYAPLQIHVRDGIAMHFDASANRYIGIGNTTPTAKLDVTGNIKAAGSGSFIKTSNNYVLVGSSNAGGASIVLDGDSNGDGSGTDYAYIEHDSSGDLNIVGDNPANASNIIFKTNSSAERLRIASNGNVKIGSGAPAIAVGGGLEIDTGSAATIRLEDSSSTSSFEIQNSGSVITQNMYNNQPWTIAYAGGERLRINSSGQVLIGTTTTPSDTDTKLRVHTTNTSSGLALEISQPTNGADKTAAALGIAINNGGASTNAADLYFETAINGSSGEKVRITRDGKLLVGLTADPAESSIVAEGNSNSGTSYAVIDLRRGSAASSAGNVCGYIRFSDTNIDSSSRNYAWIAGMADGASSSGSDNPGRLVFATCPDNSTGLQERLRITSGGNIQLSKSSAEITSNTSDGTDNKRIIIGGGGASGQDRGAQVVVHGNEYSGSGGTLQLLTGNTNSSHNMIQMYTDGNERLVLQRGGVLSQRVNSNARLSHGILEITSSSTPSQLKITTAIPYSGSGGSHAESVTIRGFRYGGRDAVDIQICWHVYANQFYNRIASSSGGWAPLITLGVENNKVVIHFDSLGYWHKIYVADYYSAFNSYTYASGWTYDFTAISGDTDTPVNTVPYKNDWGGLEYNSNHGVGTNPDRHLKIVNGDLQIGTSGHGIDFSAAADIASGETISSSVLDDYEEGSWTAADASGAGLSLANNNNGKYTKIGRMVILTFDITYPSTSDTNISRITSPFGASSGYGNGWVGWTELGRPMQLHVSGTNVYFMDNNVGGTGKHLYNNELSGKRFIGGFIVS